MKSKQVLDVQQMQYLQELGLDTNNASASWYKPDMDTEYMLMFGHMKKEELVGNEESIPAYTLQDVLDVLPKDISKDDCTWYASLYIDFENNRIEYGNTDRYGFEIYHEIMIEKYLIDAVYSMLCWLIEQGYVEMNKNE